MTQPAKSTLTTEDVEALRAGDKTVFKKIFQEYQPRLYRFLWLKLRSVDLAEDLIQETFVRLWENRQGVKPEKNFDVYLFRIAANLVVDFLRANKAKTHHIKNPDAVNAPHKTDSAAEFHQLREIVDEALSRLPEGPRTAFVLSRYEELSHKEVAEVMGISIRTVEKHIGQALQTLREHLQNLEWSNNS